MRRRDFVKGTSLLGLMAGCLGWSTAEADEPKPKPEKKAPAKPKFTSQWEPVTLALIAVSPHWMDAIKEHFGARVKIRHFPGPADYRIGGMVPFPSDVVVQMVTFATQADVEVVRSLKSHHIVYRMSDSATVSSFIEHLETIITKAQKPIQSNVKWKGLAVDLEDGSGKLRLIRDYDGSVSAKWKAWDGMTYHNGPLVSSDGAVKEDTLAILHRKMDDGGMILAAAKTLQSVSLSAWFAGK